MIHGGAESFRAVAVRAQEIGGKDAKAFRAGQAGKRGQGNAVSAIKLAQVVKESALR
jgi:hypothetical protein